MASAVCSLIYCVSLSIRSCASTGGLSSTYAAVNRESVYVSSAALRYKRCTSLVLNLAAFERAEVIALTSDRSPAIIVRRFMLDCVSSPICLICSATCFMKYRLISSNRSSIASTAVSRSLSFSTADHLLLRDIQSGNHCSSF